MIDIIPLISLIGYFFFLKNNHLNHFLVSLIFLSFFMFATNYNHYGLEIDIFRYLHRIIGVIVAIYLCIYIIKHKVNFFKEPAIVILFLFALTLFFSYFNHNLDINYYYHYSRNFIFLALIVSFIYFKVDSNNKLDELFKFILYISVFLSIFMIYELIVNDPTFLIDATWYQKWGRRISLFYSNPNYLAFALILGFVLSLYSSSRYKLLMTLLILLAIFSTGSRSVELSVVFVILIFIVYKDLKKTHLIVSICSVFIVIYLSLFSSIQIFDRIITNVNMDKSRFAFVLITKNILKEEPINGIGYGQFRLKYIDYIDQNIIDLDVSGINDAIHSYNENLDENDLDSLGIESRYIEIMTHNDLLTIAAELGAIGLIFLFYVFYKLYFEYRTLFKLNRHYFFVVLSMTTSSLIFSIFHNNLTSFVFWFILFLPFIINRNYQKKLE